MAIYFDKKHKPITFKLGDKAYITLAHSTEPDYRLPFTPSDKLSERCVSPFPVLHTHGRLAYELELPPTWSIHPFISVVHLEPYKLDPFNRELEPPPPQIVLGEEGKENDEEYEVEAILAKRYNCRKKRHEWYVKWKGYGPQDNSWEPKDNLHNAIELLDEFESKGEPNNFVTTLFLPPVASPLRIPHYKTNIIPRFR